MKKTWMDDVKWITLVDEKKNTDRSVLPWIWPKKTCLLSIMLNSNNERHKRWFLLIHTKHNKTYQNMADGMMDVMDGWWRLLDYFFPLFGFLYRRLVGGGFSSWRERFRLAHSICIYRGSSHSDLGKPHSNPVIANGIIISKCRPIIETETASEKMFQMVHG